MAKQLIVEIPWRLRDYSGFLTYAEIIEAGILSRSMSNTDEHFLFYLEEAVAALFESKLVNTDYAIAWEDFYEYLDFHAISSFIRWIDNLSIPVPPEHVSFFNSTSVTLIY